MFCRRTSKSESHYWHVTQGCNEYFNIDVYLFYVIEYKQQHITIANVSMFLMKIFISSSNKYTICSFKKIKLKLYRD